RRRTLLRSQACEKCRPSWRRAVILATGAPGRPARWRRTMRYMLMLNAEEGQWASFPADVQARHMAAYEAFTKALADEGRLVASGRLALSETAKTIQTKGGKTVVMDG